LEEEINSSWNRAECEIGVNRWKRGRCGQMCSGTCLLDAPDQWKLEAARKLDFLSFARTVLVVVSLFC